MIHYEAVHKRDVKGDILAGVKDPEPFFTEAGDVPTFKDVLELLAEESLFELNVVMKLSSGCGVALAMTNRDGMGTWVVTAFDMQDLE